MARRSMQEAVASFVSRVFFRPVEFAQPLGIIASGVARRRTVGLAERAARRRSVVHAGISPRRLCTSPAVYLAVSGTVLLLLLLLPTSPAGRHAPSAARFPEWLQPW